MRTNSHDVSADAAAAVSNLFTTKNTDFAAYLVASDSLPYGGARIGETDRQPCTVFCFEDTQSIGRKVIRQFFTGKCERIEPKALLSAHKFVRPEVTRVRQTAEGAR